MCCTAKQIFIYLFMSLSFISFIMFFNCFDECFAFLLSNKLFLSLKAAGPRSCNGAARASLKKYPADFFNPDFVGTEPQEAPNA